jgi:filamentous hemagglutinin family protein
MKINGFPVGLAVTLSLFPLIWVHPAAAQVVSDGSLSTTVISGDGRNFVVRNGDRAGNNLFHSFREFSVPTGGSAVFNNEPDVQTIFSRVTGSNVSNIDGLIRANGNASLFLLNPSGILFGPNARLVIGGSFVASTASRLRFTDGFEFSTSDLSASPLLSVNVPVGLQFGATAATLTNRSQVAGVRGTPAGLQVRPSQTLALIGGDITFESGHVSASAGHLELGSVAPNSFVTITPVTPGFRFGYADVQDFGEIRLLRGSVADTTGVRGGSIQIQAAQLRVRNVSSISANTAGDQDSGTIRVRTTDLVEISGISPTAQIRTGIIGTVLQGASGQGSSIDVITPRLYIRNGLISNGTFGSGDSGGLRVRANDMQIVRTPVRGSVETSRLAVGLLTGVLPNATGKGGNISVEGDRLLISGGAQISAGTFGQGNSGSITVRANQIDLVGTGTAGQSSSITAGVPFRGATGRGGSVRVQADQLRLLDGGQISTTTAGTGNAGNIEVNAQRIEIAGRSSSPDRNNDLLSSSITAEALATSNAVIFGAVEPPPGTIRTGSAGFINITTQELLVRDGGDISVSNLTRFGNAGDLNITANSIDLDQGRLEANIRAGNRGNINLNVDSGIVRMLRGSEIITNAQDEAIGGNINLRTRFLVALENSDISANAENNFGGRIAINAQGIFGTAFRPDLTSESDITAFSQRGAEFSGNVEFTTPGVDPSQGLITLPEQVIDPNQQITNTCGSTQDSQFIVTGRGGIPANPTQAVVDNHLWSDIRDLSTLSYLQESVQQSVPVQAAQVPAAGTVLESTGWTVNAKGKTELVAIAAIPPWNHQGTCSGHPSQQLTQIQSTISD